MRLILVRHGETVWNREGRYLGHTDFELNETGLRQAMLAAGFLREEKIKYIFSSSLKRAKQTVWIISATTQAEIIIDDRLNEISFGVFEGMTFSEAKEKYPGMMAAWLEDFDQAPSGGESFSSLCERVAEFLKMLDHEENDDCIVIVSHGGALRELIRQVLGLPQSAHWYFSFSPGSISEILIFASGPIVSYLNLLPGAAA